MKLKDIEKKLKREQDVTVVPDVYSRVSTAPLNKLLEGETPAKAFQKQLVLRLLVVALALFLVAAIGLSAMWLSPDNTAYAPDCYASVTVMRDGDINIRLGLIMSGGNRVVTTVTEISNGTVNKAPIVSHSARISDFINPKADDKVRIELLCYDPVALTRSSQFLVSELEFVYSNIKFAITAASNTEETKREVLSYIAYCGGDSVGDLSVEAIIKRYNDIFA